MAGWLASAKACNLPSISIPFAWEFWELGHVALFKPIQARSLERYAGTSKDVASLFSVFSDLISLTIPNLPANSRYPNRLDQPLGRGPKFP